MERIIALIFLILLSPLILLLCLVVKATSPGPFLFSQKRMGKNFKPFFIYKVRTMQEDAERKKNKLIKFNEADGPVFKIYNDPRLTAIGKILWKTGIDEVVQLLNIVKGEMSFVGPRPLPIAEANKIPKKYRERFSLKPGMTSLWIIRGSHKLSFKQWMESDLEYLRRKNLFLDFYIMASTLDFVIRSSFIEFKRFFAIKSS